jgi:hypothetical protein
MRVDPSISAERNLQVFRERVTGVRWFEEQGAVSDCGAYVFRLKILGSI